MKEKIIKSIPLRILYVASAIIFLLCLKNSSASIVSFVIISILAVLSIKKEMDKRQEIILMSLSLLFGIIIAFANYDCLNTLSFVGVALSGGVIAYGCLNMLLSFSLKAEAVISEKKAFWMSFITISGIFILFLYFYVFPGIITGDATTILEEIFSGSYSNRHPYIYVLMLKVLLSFFKLIFGSYFAALVAFLTLQCVFCGFVIAYAISALRKYTKILIIVYILLMYNMVYATTLSKDTLFAYMNLLMIVALYKLLKEENRKDLILFIIGMVGVSVFRLNGIIECAVIVPALFIIKRRSIGIKASIVLGISAFVTVIIPIIIGLEGSGVTETTTIMQQQLARAITDSEVYIKGSDNFVNIAEWQQSYTPDYGDDIKFRLRGGGYIEEHFDEFVDLWRRTGLKYPDSYIKGFIDTTKFYYNAGYIFNGDKKFWTVYNYNSPGIYWTAMYYPNLRKNIPELIPLIENYDIPFLQGFLKIDILSAVGFHSWILD